MNEQTFFTAHSIIKQLVEDFQANENSFLDSKYSEAQARLDFIDKFWIALGWDVNHEREKNPYEQEVKVERGVAVSNRLKKADYAFFAAPNFRDVKFYVEAKKPSRNLDNADDYFQTIRYGWSSNTPIAVLTDFEQFRVLDCRYKPNIKTAENFALDKLKFNYREYIDEDKFREIYYLFSRDSVIGGSLDNYAKNLPKRGRGAKQGKLFATAIQKSVDESFLDDLDGYREQFARAFKNKNADLDGEDLTEAVTRTIDRLVFIRFLEDKLIEPDTMIDKFDSWADFVKTSRNLNSFYNGVVFKPHYIDSTDFNADEKVFADICDEFSPKDSPYNFNYIPVHILGSIYERFLGKVIVATDKRATVEEKPEVRKAGGVYYTPEYIVRYIVENTIGKLLDDKGGNPRVSKGAENSNDENTLTNVRVSAITPEDVKEMCFADIACGSGSFLLGVYDYLLRWQTNYYNQVFSTKTPTENRQREARKAGCIENKDGSFTLSIAQRRDILSHNIYGVDVDAQATEVAQLSLALKLLEDATTSTTRAFQPKLGEKLLPDMTKNIVCGNSLVDWDILDGQLFERRDERKLNPMSYDDKFPEVMKRGGFDAIVGNPPWGAEITTNAINYLQNKYKAAQTATKDSYSLFSEKALTLLKEKGQLGYITPDTFLRKNDYLSLRKLILTNYCIKELIETGPVFAQVRDTWCLIFTVSKEKITNENKIIHKKISRFIVSAEDRLEKFGKLSWDEESEISQNTWINSPNLIVGYLAFEEKQQIIQKMETQRELKQQTNYRVSRGEEGSKFNIVSDVDGDFNLVIPADVSRYDVLNGVKVFSHTLTRNKVATFYSHPKIWITRIQKMRWKQRIVCGFDERTNSGGMKTSQVIVSTTDNQNELKYLLGILSSSLINFYCINYLSDDMNQSYLEKLPIRTINFNNPPEKSAHDKIVALVEQMLEAKKNLQTARSDKDQTYYQDRCHNLDKQIDKLVYDLYELTAEEIAIVEGVGK